jgi:ABC-2 type transport system permease protein
MSAVAAIVAVTARRLQGERRLPFFLLGLPILIMLLVGTIFGTGPERLVIGVVAPEGDRVADSLVDAVRESSTLKPRHFGGEGTARRSVRRGRITAALVIPPGYGDAVRRGETGAVEVIVQPGRSESFEARIAIGGMLARFNVDVVTARAIQAGSTFESALQRARSLTASTPDFLAEEEDRESPFAYTAPSNLVLFAFITALVTSAAIVDARRTGVTRRVLASPTRPSSVVTAELVAAFLTALFQATVMLVIGAVFFGVDFGSPVGVAALIVAIALASAASGSLLATFVRTPEQAISFGPPIGIALGMLGGTMWPLEDIGPLLRAVGHITPHAWAMDGFVDLIFGEAGLAEVGRELGVLLAMSVALLALATTRLRRAILFP